MKFSPVAMLFTRSAEPDEEGAVAWDPRDRFSWLEEQKGLLQASQSDRQKAWSYSKNQLQGSLKVLTWA